MNARLPDIGRRAGYWTTHLASDLAAVVQGRLAAPLDLLAGDPGRALLRYGHLVRHVQLARESLATYRRVERLTSRHRGRLAAWRPALARPKTLLFFVGYSRSGHSLVASLLDAHPNMLVAHELHALKHLARGHGFAEIVRAIQYNSLFFKHFGRSYFGYDYEIAGQYQGTHTELLIIGDKKANGTGRILRRNPAIVEHLERTLPVPFIFLHVVRDPLDNIASRARRTGTSLEWAARGYFANAEAIEDLKRRHPDKVVELYLDDLIADPHATLTGLLRRLRITDIPQSYLRACAERVHREPSRTRDQVTWAAELRRSIQHRATAYGFLRRFADGAPAIRPAAGSSLKDRGAGDRLARVAILMSARQITSRERMFLDLAARLAERGTRVDILAAGPSPELRAAVQPPLELHDIDPAWVRRSGLRLPHVVRMYSSVPGLAGYLRRVRPDVLFATSIPPNLVALGGKRLAGGPTRIVVRHSNALRIRGSPRYGSVRRRPRDWLVPHLYPKADAVVAVSSGVADNLRALAPLAPGRLHTIENGVPLDHITELAAEPLEHPWFRPGAPAVLLAVGRLVRKKNHPTLLRALASVREQREVRLVILGDGPERARLERLIEHLGLRDAVLLPGFASNPFAWMARADLFVSSSISEGMASALIEALACGCPVVATDCPSGPAEILQGGEFGRLVPVGDVDALAAAIAKGLDQAPARDRLRARAAELSCEVAVGRYLDLLMQVAKGG